MRSRSCGNAGSLKLGPGEVHGKPDLAGRQARIHEIVTGPLDRPSAERPDEPARLGRAEEGLRGQLPALRVVPPQQRLDAHEGPVVQPESRLVDQDELTSLQRCRQVLLQPPAVACRTVEVPS